MVRVFVSGNLACSRLDCFVLFRRLKKHSSECAVGEVGEEAAYLYLYRRLVHEVWNLAQVLQIRRALLLLLQCQRFQFCNAEFPLSAHTQKAPVQTIHTCLQVRLVQLVRDGITPP